MTIVVALDLAQALLRCILTDPEITRVDHEDLLDVEEILTAIEARHRREVVIR